MKEILTHFQANDQNQKIYKYYDSVPFTLNDVIGCFDKKMKTLTPGAEVSARVHKVWSLSCWQFQLELEENFCLIEESEIGEKS